MAASSASTAGTYGQPGHKGASAARSDSGSFSVVRESVGSSAATAARTSAALSSPSAGTQRRARPRISTARPARWARAPMASSTNGPPSSRIRARSTPRSQRVTALSGSGQTLESASRR